MIERRKMQRRSGKERRLGKEFIGKSTGSVYLLLGGSVTPSRKVEVFTKIGVDRRSGTDRRKAGRRKS